MTPPTLKPKVKPIDKRVFLERESWEDLSEIAEFHSAVFTEMGADEKVSRNDIIQAFLDWAVDEYWKDKGGKPKSDRERAEMVKRHAEKLARDVKRGGEGE